jgi:hypothetical protein
VLFPEWLFSVVPHWGFYQGWHLNTFEMMPVIISITFAFALHIFCASVSTVGLCILLFSLLPSSLHFDHLV